MRGLSRILRPGSASGAAALGYMLGFGDAIDATPFLLGRGNREPEFLLQRARENAAHGVALPTGGVHHFVDRGALGSPQHSNHRALLSARTPPERVTRQQRQASM